MLELISIKKKYITKAGDTQALDDVSLRFEETGLVFITGKSGSGKTTLLNVIGGLDGFDSGEIRLNGKSFAHFTDVDFDSYRNTFVGFVFQEYNLLPEYSVQKNVDIALELQGKNADAEYIKQLFESVEIEGLENRKPNQLSGGQKQRVAIVRALIKNPQIILADELTGALDSTTGEQVIQILKKLSKEKLVIVVSHDLELAERYADRMIKIADGKIVEDITLNEAELQGNLYQTEGNLTVKQPSVLTHEENEILLRAIKENQKITFTDKITVRERADTVEPEQKPAQDVNLINSKMKLGSAMSLGVKSLWTKPLRLIITVLLSVVAFAVFGLFDAIASYNNAKVITSLLREGAYDALPVYATYNDEYYDNTQLKISQSQIQDLTETTGYTFRGVYDLIDTDVVRSNSDRKGFNASVEIDELPVETSTKPNGWAYYTRSLNGIVVFDGAEVVKQKLDGQTVNVIDPQGFNYKILYGEYPTYPAFIENDDGTTTEVLQIAISSYVADSIRFWSKSNETYADFIGRTIKLGENTYTITAIVDCGKIPEKYNALKNNVETTLKQDFTTYLYSSCYLNVFAPTGLVERLRANNDRTVNYYADYKNTVQSLSIDGIESNFCGRYYNVAEIDVDKYLFFDETKSALGEGEALISVNDLRVEYAVQDLKSTGDLQTVEYLKNAIYALHVSGDAIPRDKLTDFCNYLEDIREKNDGLSGACKTLQIQSRKTNGSMLLNEGTLKIVGVYFGVNTDTDTKNSFISKIEPLVVASQSFSALNICAEQGIYSRALAPIVKNRTGESVMGLKMDQTVGVNYNWFGNSILETVSAEREMIDQVLNLVLYIAIALAVFSVFMLFNYISISISSKQQTIGILRTLGANKKNIFVMFITEALIISLINGIFACLLGYFGCMFINTYLVDTMNLTLNIAMFDVRQVFIISIGSIITGVLSSLVPIIKIAKKKPVELIRAS